MKDLYHNIAVEQALDPVVATATQTSSAIEMQGFESLAVVVNVGESGDTLSDALNWTITLEHSDESGSGFESVAAASLHNGASSVVIDDAAEDDVAITFGYAGNKRYVRAVATAAGSHSNGTPMAVTAIKGHASSRPING